MDNRNVIASSLTDNELARAFSELVAGRWDDWDLTPYMAYLVDSCAPSLLPVLAEQFDMEGLQGFAVAATEQQQRDLIKRSITLHKFIGTPWAIREACRTVGFPVIVLEEGVTVGEPTTDDWARFRVLVEADFERYITADDGRKLRAFVEYYKNARSHLAELGFYQSITDKMPHAGDTMDIITHSLTPNPVVLDPSGAEKTVYVASSAPWHTDKSSYMWGDGSESWVYLTVYDDRITVRSDANTTAARQMPIDILSGDGRVIGTLAVRQLLTWGNAYSAAYSRAYNTLPVKSVNAYSPAYGKSYFNDYYARFDAENISVEASGAPTEAKIYSNSDWEIK